jgi:hypothetical protein
MSGSGQIIGGIIGAVVSIFVPGAGMAVGWAVGSLIGGLIIRKEPTKGPRLEDIKVQSSEYGRPIPIVYGQMGIQGNVIWLAPIIERSHEEGGKGGGSGVTVYDYYATFAVAFCEGTHQITRLWAGLEKRLIYDANDPVPNTGFGLKLYNGSEDQLPDPTMESFEGVGNVPGYRGTVYAVFTDFALKTDNNTIPLITAEFGVGGTLSVPFLEYVYPVIGGGASEAYPTELQLGTNYWQLSGPICYIESTNEFWAVCMPQWSADWGTFNIQQNIIQIMDANTMFVKEYIQRTTEPNNINFEGSNSTYQNLWYDKTTDCVYWVAGSGTFSPNVDADRILYKYDRASRTLLGTLNLGDDVRWARHFSHPDLPVGYFVATNTSNSQLGWLIEVDLGLMSILMKKSDFTFHGYVQSPVTKTLFPGRLAVTEDNTVYGLVQVVTWTPFNRVLDITQPANTTEGGSARSLDAGQYLYRMEAGSEAFVDVVQLPRAYYSEIFQTLEYVKEHNAIYLVTGGGDGPYNTDPSRPERVFKYNIATGVLSYLFTLPCYDPAPMIPDGFGSYNSEPGHGSRSMLQYTWDPGLPSPFRWNTYSQSFWYHNVYKPDASWTYPTVSPTSQPFFHVNYYNRHYALELDSTTGAVLIEFQMNSKILPKEGTYYYTDVTDLNSGLVFTPVQPTFMTYLIPEAPIDGSADWADTEYFKYDGPQGVIVKIGTERVVQGNPVVHLWEVVTDVSIRCGLTPDDLDVADLTDIVDGYVIPKPTTAREALDALRPVYFFDGVESEGKNKFRKRGRAVQIILNPDYLRAFSPGSTSPRDPLLTIRQMDQELPHQVTVTYLTPAKKYDTAVKYARRLAQHGSIDYSLAVSMQFSDTKAQEVANNNLWAAWVERVTYEFQLPYNYACSLEPTDKVQIAGYTMRIIKATLAPHGAISFEAVRDQGLTSDVIESVYNDFSPKVVTETPLDPGTLPAAQATNLELL